MVSVELKTTLGEMYSLRLWNEQALPQSRNLLYHKIAGYNILGNESLIKTRYIRRIFRGFPIPRLHRAELRDRNLDRVLDGYILSRVNTRSG